MSALEKILRPFRVATRPSSFQIRRRNVASGIPIPGSGLASPAGDDPNATVSFLQSNHSAEPHLSEIECSEAAVCALTHGHRRYCDRAETEHCQATRYAGERNCQWLHRLYLVAGGYRSRN